VVARKCAVAFEARNSLLMRLAVRLGLPMEFEIDPLAPEGAGGVNNRGVPNFIYRWTEREVRDTVASYDPARVPSIHFFYDLRLPIQRFTRSGMLALRMIALAVEPATSLFAKILPTQCNEFAFAIFKGERLQPWIRS